MKIQAIIGSALLALVLATGGCGSDSDPDTSDTDPTKVLRDVVTGLENQDGPTVCAQLHRNAQEALSAARKAPDCITAVGSGPFDAGLLSEAAGISDGDIEVDGQHATADGPGAAALAELLGVPGIWLSEFEDTWTIQSEQDGTGGTAG